jgi:hypothetical protein
LRINAPPLIGGADDTFRPVLFYMGYGEIIPEHYSSAAQFLERSRQVHWAFPV